jgi:hypothetical protein
MGFLTEDFVRRRARARASAKNRTLDDALRAEARQERSHYDVFLSQTIHDREVVFGVYAILTEDLGLAVFCDWIEAPETDRSKVTPANARYIKERMGRSDTLLFLDTEAADQSKWMCWELGWFDGAKDGKVGILPVVRNANSPYRGREFLGLYPIVETDEAHRIKVSVSPEMLLETFGPGVPMAMALSIPLAVWQRLPASPWRSFTG